MHSLAVFFTELYYGWISRYHVSSPSRKTELEFWLEPWSILQQLYDRIVSCYVFLLNRTWMPWSRVCPRHHPVHHLHQACILHTAVSISWPTRWRNWPSYDAKLQRKRNDCIQCSSSLNKSAMAAMQKVETSASFLFCLLTLWLGTIELKCSLSEILSLQ